MSSLHGKLRQLYPLSHLSNDTDTEPVITHMHYKDVNFFVEYTPLMVAYIVLFLYIYFSVRELKRNFYVIAKWLWSDVAEGE